MNLKRNLRSILTTALAAPLLAAGGLALVAENAASPAPATSARITALAGTLLDVAGRPLNVGSELKPGALVKTAPGDSAQLVLGQGGISSSIICIAPDSEIAFVKFSASTDEDYPVLDAELSLRNAQVRADAKRIF